MLAYLALWGPASAATGDGVRLDLVGPALPWAQVTYEVAARHGSVSARVSKAFPAGFGRRDEVGLLPADELEPLLREVGGLLAGCTPGRGGARVTYTLTLVVGGRETRCRVHDPDLSDDQPVNRAIRAVRAVALANTAPIEFRDALLLPDESGRLLINAEPTARVIIDGVQVADRTPVHGLRLPIGAHQVRLEPLDGGSARVYPIKIETKKTTALVVDLR